MSLIDTLQQTSGLSTLSPTSTSATSAISTDKDSQQSDLFASFLSMMQSESNNSSDISDNIVASAVTNTMTNMDDTLESMQQSLLSGLGLGGLSHNTLSMLDSESSLSTLQANLLSHLQSNLFGAFNGASSEALSDATSNILDETADSDTLFSFLTSSADYAAGEDGLNADDFFDTINILNHIPVVADAYQKTTSTTVDPISDIVGGYAYGGVLGLGYAAVNLAVESWTGKSIVTNISDYFFDDAQQEVLQSTTDTVSDTIKQASNAYQFVKRDYKLEVSTSLTIARTWA